MEIHSHGFWERFIGITKTGKVLGKSLVDMETLNTVVTEDRPLTYISPDINDPEPLTLSHLLLGRRIKSFPQASFEFEESNAPLNITHTSLSKQKRRHCEICGKDGKMTI